MQAIELSEMERNILIAALKHPAFHGLIELPKTQRVIRQTYKAVRDKLKGMKFMGAGSEETAGEVEDGQEEGVGGDKDGRTEA